MDIDVIKRELNITWEDEITDKEVQDAMTSAKAIIDDFAAESVDLDTDLVAAQLYKDAARYYFNKVGDEFEVRFQPQLIALRTRYQVKRYEEQEDEV